MPVGAAVRVAGRLHRLGEDRIWVFIEDLVEGKRVWIFGGEARTDAQGFSFAFRPTQEQAGMEVTLTVVRADRHADLHLRGIELSGHGVRRLHNVPLRGCRPLGSVTVHVRG